MTTILPTTTTSRRAMPMVMRMLLAVLATVLLGIGFSLAGVSSAANANPCNYGKQVYCDGADEPVWQWDGVDDIECVGIPGVTQNSDGTVNYSGVIGQVYYFSGGGYSLVHDSGAVAAPAPAAPAPAAPAAPAPAAPAAPAEPTTTDPAAAATTASSAPTATATPTAKPTSKPTASATTSPTITGGVSGTDAGSTSAAGDAGTGSGSAAIWLLGGLAVAAGAALGGYTVIRRRRGALASAAASASTTEPTP